MLELIRKQQKWILILVAVIIFFAFAWWGDFFGKSETVRGRGQPVIGFGGKTYTQGQIESLAMGARFAQQYFPTHTYQITAYEKYSGSAVDYALNTMALRKHAADYGIAVSAEEIDERMLSIPDFQTPEARARTFQLYGMFGLGQAEMAEIIGDVILLEKLNGLLSAGLIASETGAKYNYSSRYQNIFSSVATFPEVKSEDIEVTEDELKEAYEANKSQLKTERKVAIQYVYFKSPEQEAAEKAAAEKAAAEKAAAEKAAAEKAAAEKAAQEKAAKEKSAEDAAKKAAEEKSSVSEGETGQTEGDSEGGAETTDTPEKAGGDAPTGAGTPAGTEGDEGVDGAAGSEGGKPDPTSPEEPEAKGTESGSEPLDNPTPPATGGESPEEDSQGSGGGNGESGGAEGAKPAISPTTTPVDKGAEPDETVLSEEEKTRLVQEFNEKVDAFWKEFFNDTEFNPNVDFATVAKDPKYGVTVVKTEMFSTTDPPEGIADQTKLIEAIALQRKDLPVSDPIPAGGDKIGYFIFELVSIEEPREKTFEESKAELEEMLKGQKAQEATLAAVDEARGKVVTALEEGKSFSDAAKSAGFEVEELKPFSPSEPPMELPNLGALYTAFMESAPGEVSEPIEVPGGRSIVYVSKRELWKRVDAETLKDGIRRSAVSGQSRTLLRNWFLEVRDAWDERPL